MKSPTTTELDCLTGWPAGTKGEAQDRALIQTLLSLCEEHGFGRVPEVAAKIEQIWRDPSIIERFQREKLERLEMLANDKRQVEKDRERKRSQQE